MADSTALFHIGQLVQHRLFDYRGVIWDVDPHFLGTDEWYDQVAKTRPPKDEPWYRVLVHDAQHETYVAERNLAPDHSGDAINHPMIEQCFLRLEDGQYHPRMQRN